MKRGLWCLPKATVLPTIHKALQFNTCYHRKSYGQFVHFLPWCNHCFIQNSKAAPALTTAPLHPSLTTPASFWSTLSAKLPGVTKTNQAMLREESCVRGQELSAQGTEGSLPRNKIRGYQVQRKLLFRKNKVAIWDDLKQNSVG